MLQQDNFAQRMDELAKFLGTDLPRIFQRAPFASRLVPYCERMAGTIREAERLIIRRRRTNLNGGLTLVPMPGFEDLARETAAKIESIRQVRSDGSMQLVDTPVDIAVPKFGLRSSGEPLVQLSKKHIGGHDCVVITSGPGTYEMLGQLLFLLGQLKGRRARRISVVTAYYPLCRSDKDEGELELAVVRLVTDVMIAATNGTLDRIIAVDLHAPQTVTAGPMGLITEVSMVRRVLRRAVSDALEISKRLVLVLSDEGVLKRPHVKEAVALVQEEFDIKLPHLSGSKERKDDTESKLLGFTGDVTAAQGAIALGLDDEAATIGTLINNAGSLKEDLGALEVWGLVTHGVLCGPAAKRLSVKGCPLDRIYATNTIPLRSRERLQPLLESGKIVEVSWSHDLGWIVCNHHWDSSIRGVR